MNGDAQVELCQRVKALMASDKSLDYATAMRNVGRDDRDLWHRYLGTRRGSIAHYTVNQAETAIALLARETVAASEGTLDYGTALKAVLSDRPDLARAWKDTMR